MSLIVAMTALRLYIVYDEPLIARTLHDHDDAMFVDLADSILGGKWLGTYDEYTLMKGPGYPLWLALNAYFKIPVIFAQQVLYVVACGLMCLALKWLSPSRRWLAMVYVALIWAPSSYDGWMFILQRVGLYASLPLLVLAGATGLLGAVTGPVRFCIAWIVLFSLSATMLWLTREEGFWVLPGLVPLFFFACVRVYRGAPDRIAFRVLLMILPIGFVVAGVHSICLINHSYYGYYGITDFKSEPFKKAYGALIRAGGPDSERYIPLSKEKREDVYEVSTAFESIRVPLERRVRWVRADTTRKELHSGWLGMAFRLSVGEMGYYENLRSTMDYYDLLARQINRACDDGRLSCGSYRASFVPPMRPEYLQEIIPVFVEASEQFLTFSYQPRFENYSRIRGTNGAVFSRITNSKFAIGGGLRLTRRSESLAEIGPTPLSKSVGKGIRFVYAALFPYAALLAAVCLILRTVSDTLRKRFPYEVLFVASILLITVGKLLLQCYVELAAIFGLYGRYLMPLYPLVIVSIALSFALVFRDYRVFQFDPGEGNNE